MTLIINGDCLEELRGMPDNSVDAVITDPPYGLSNTTPTQVAETIAAWVTGDREHVPAVSGGFMGAAWDAFVPPPAVWDEVYRVLKPGGHAAVFSGTRTIGLMDMSIRLAGFDHRDTIGAGLMAWVTGQGFPKSQDVSKAIDKMGGNPLAFRRFAKAYAEAVAGSEFKHTDIDRHLGIKSSSCYWAREDHRGGMPPRHHWEQVRDLLNLDDELANLYDEAEREVIGTRQVPKGHAFAGSTYGGDSSNREYADTTAATVEARKWEGWGTQLKPSWEPILLYRKPFRGTVAANVLTWGTGAINVDATRVTPLTEAEVARSGKSTNGGVYGKYGSVDWKTNGAPAQGRFPANVVLDRANADRLDQQSGNRKSPSTYTRSVAAEGEWLGRKEAGTEQAGYGDSGGASRFFHVTENLDGMDAPFKYCPKAPKKERPSYVDDEGTTVQHPTTKPLTVMRWLVRLLTPPGGTVLDPFAGSGTTVEAALLEGMNPIGIEAHTPYIPLIHQRVARATATEDTLPIGDAA